MGKVETDRGFAVVMAVCVLLIGASSPTYAYIDPGTGSFILQMLLAGFFAFLFMLKQVRLRVKRFVVELFNRNKDE